MKHHLPRIFGIAFLTVFLGSGIDYLSSNTTSSESFETSLGLDTLFKMRGVRPVPENVVIVAMDENSESRLQVGEDLTEWRRFHARVIKELQQQDVALMIFDLQFMQHESDIDQDLAAAMKAAGNVLLTNCVQKFRRANQDFYGREECSEKHKQPFVSKTVKSEIPIDSAGNDTRLVQKSSDEETQLPEILSTDDHAQLADNLIAARQIEPIAELKSVALDYAPFYLAYSAENDKIREAWLFADMLADTPSLPLVVWLYALQQQDKLPNISGLQPRFAETLTKLRHICLANPLEFTAVLQNQSLVVEQLQTLLCEGYTRYLDFYGPPRTLRMVSYADVYDGKVGNLKDKIVFIGKASRSYSSSRIDVFSSPFTTSESGKMSGVEIMATEFANLSESRFIEAPVPPILMLTIYGLLMAILLTMYAGRSGLIAVLLCSVVYVAGVQICFTAMGWWLPLAVPILIQLPISLMISLWDWLRKWRPNSIAAKQGDSVCMLTDIEGYTTISGKLTANQNAKLIEAYREVLRISVQARRGVVHDFTGDQMMAYWIDMSVDKRRLFACCAALEILLAVEKFNQNCEIPLPIRIGLFEGEIALAPVRVTEIWQYRATGDPLNIAQRIEGVNKVLGTRILVNKPMTAKISSLFFRPVGAFLVVGRDEPIELMELIGWQNLLDEVDRSKYQLFDKGLIAFQQQLWQVAVLYFQTILAQYGHDGPTAFYLDLSLSYQLNPAKQWEGYVTMDKK